MRVNNLGRDIGVQPSFQRAFTTKESQKWEQIQKEAKSTLGAGDGDTLMICFDSCMPEATDEDKGIGSSFSNEAEKFVKFMKKMTGITGVQYAPQGRLSGLSPSPFSGTAFALGEQIIDLKQLTNENFENILPKKEFQKVLVEGNAEKVDYSRILPKNNPLNAALDVAFENFEKLSSTSPLKAQYEDFLSKNSNWLEKEALYDCLEKANGGKFWKEWDSNFDKDLFSGKLNKNAVDARIKEIKSEHQNTYNKTLFTQFVLYKQQKETKEKQNADGIKLAGDCLIGFSEKEHWANREAFAENQYLGCKNNNPDDPGEGNWGIPALNMEKIGTENNLGPAGKLYAQKLEKFFERYDIIRIDAAWQLIQPYNYVEQADGKRIPMKNQPSNMGDKLLKIMDATLKKTRPNDWQNCKVNLELLGGPVDFKDKLLKGRTQIHHSIYQHPTWGSVQFYKENGLNENEFIFGLGTHDDESLIEISTNPAKIKEQAPVLAEHMKLDKTRLSNSQDAFCAAKFGEIFTTKNNFFTVFDALGLNKRINNQKPQGDNWNARTPYNYEEVYHKNLTEKKGLNLADAYLKAMDAKNIKNEGLKRKLEQANNILSKNDMGIYTESDANKKLGENYSELS